VVVAVMVVVVAVMVMVVVVVTMAVNRIRQGSRQGRIWVTETQACLAVVTAAAMEVMGCKVQSGRVRRW
jgi:NADH:ubiquinone oxidoreductase subunit 6 (subunit J)